MKKERDLAKIAKDAKRERRRAKGRELGILCFLCLLWLLFPSILLAKRSCSGEAGSSDWEERCLNIFNIAASRLDACGNRMELRSNRKNEELVFLRKSHKAIKGYLGTLVPQHPGISVPLIKSSSRSDPVPAKPVSLAVFASLARVNFSSRPSCSPMFYFQLASLGNRGVKPLLQLIMANLP